MRCIFLVLNNCTKYCPKKRKQDRNEIGAMHFLDEIC